MNITVKVSDLLKMANELNNDGIEYVELTVLEADDFPNSLHFEGYDGEGGGIDYETIDEVKISPTYKYD